MANAPRCPRHRWTGPLFRKGPTPELRQIAMRLRFLGGYRCTECGAPGRSAGKRIQAFAPARAREILLHVEGWNRRCAAAVEPVATERRAA